MQNQKCSNCGEVKPQTKEFFNKSIQNVSNNGFRYDCKICSNKYAKASRDKYKGTDQDYYKSKEFVYSQLKYQAKKRGYAFEITFEYYAKNLANKKCQYCGSENTKHWVDRYINTEGYTKKNSVPCCQNCNRSKMAHDPIEWLNHCKKIVEYNKL